VNIISKECLVFTIPKSRDFDIWNSDVGFPFHFRAQSMATQKYLFLFFHTHNETKTTVGEITILSCIVANEINANAMQTVMIYNGLILIHELRPVSFSFTEWSR
jgi:hypothetical protein